MYLLKNALYIFALLCVWVIDAQIETSVKFNKMASGRNFSFDVSKTFNEKNNLGFGIRYNINSLKLPDDQFNVFYRRQFATKPYHHFGLRGFYQRKILLKWKHIEPFVFYDIQATYNTTRNVWYWPEYFDTTINAELYKRFEVNFGPFTWLEQSIGLGYKVLLTENIFITSQFGIEGMLVFGRDDSLLVTWNGPNFEFGYLFDFGIGYRFKM